MLAEFVGQVDIPAATVLIAICALLAVTVVTVVTNYRTQQTREHAFVLEKMKLEDANRQELYKSETDRAYRFKLVEEKLITSYKVDSEGKRVQ